jgi:hypothetical protein
VAMKNSIIWDLTPCSPIEVHLRFGGIYFNGITTKEKNFNAMGSKEEEKLKWKRYIKN